MECTHRAIRSWSQLDGSPVEMWSCVDCGWRFEPVRESETTKPMAWIWTWYDIANDRHVRRIIDCEKKPNIPGYDLIPLYTHPPQRKPLTDEEVTALVLEWWCPTMVTAKDRKFVRAIERAHGIGGEE